MRRPVPTSAPILSRLSPGERLSFAVLGLAAISAVVPMRIAASDGLAAPVARACHAAADMAHPYGAPYAACPPTPADQPAVTASVAAFRMAAIFLP